MKKYIYFIAILLLIGCGSIPNTRYYLIDYPVEGEPTAEPAIDAVLGVAKFKAEPLYENDRIVYRDNPYEGKFYHYHRWVTSPKDMVTDKVIEQLSAGGLFTQVVYFPHTTDIDYLLRGTIKAFEEWDEPETWQAHVKIHFELIRRTDSVLLWQDTLTQKTTVNNKTPLDVVRAISVSLQSVVDEAAKHIAAEIVE